MALVKKLQTGGLPTSLDDELNKELASYNLKSKDERKVRDALVQFRDYFANPQGKTFAVDPVAQKYTISGEGSEKFVGSPDEVKSNWFTGKVKIKDDADAMSIAAAIYNGATTKLKNTTTTTPGTTSSSTKEKLGIGNFNNYMVDEAYGGETNFAGDFGKIRTDDERKKVIMQHANDFATKYLTLAEANPEQYEDIDKVKAMQQAIATGDWNTFQKATYPLKWTVGDFLVQSNEKEAFDAEDAKQTTQVNIEKLIASGLAPQLAEKFAAAGFTSQENLLGVDEKTNAAIKNYIKPKRGIILSNPQGLQMIIDNLGNVIDAAGTEFTQFDPLYGTSWRNDQNAGFTLGKAKYEIPDAGDIGKGLNLPDFAGWTATGWSRASGEEAPAVDIMGNRDYTKYIDLTRPGYAKVRLTKGTNGYTSSDGKVYPTLNISGYKPAFDVQIQSWQLPKELINIEASEVIPETSINQAVQGVVNVLEGTGEIDADTKDQIRDVVKSLKYIKDNSPSRDTKILALKQLSAINELLKREQLVLKTGGKIRKGQAGLQMNSYLEKYAKPSTFDPNAQRTASTKSRDISNLVRGSSDLDKAILATNAGMLLPGFAGVASGLTATALEAVKGAKDGWSWGDTGNVALNLGLTAAAFIGLGGLKAATKGTQLGAKIVKAAQSGKEAQSLSKATKFAQGEMKQATNLVEQYRTTANAAGAKLGDNLLDIAAHAKSAGKKEVAEAAAKVSGFSEYISKSSLLGSLVPTSAKTIKNIDRVGKYTALGMGAMNLPGAIDAGKKILSGNISELTINDANALTAVAFGTKVGKHAVKREIGKRYGTVAETSTSAGVTAEIKGEKIPFHDPTLFEKQKSIMGFKPWTKGKTKTATKEEINKAILEKYNAGKEGDALAKLEDIKNVKPIEATSSGRVLREEYDQNKDFWLQTKGMKWAKKYGLAEPKPPRVKPERTKEKEEMLKKYLALREQQSTLKKNVKNKEIGKEIETWKKKVAKNPSWIGKQALSKREQAKSDYFAELNKFSPKTTPKKEKGGVIKFAGGGVYGTKKIEGAGPKALKFIGDNYDPTSALNLLGFAATVGANRRAGNEQRKAAANAVYRIPTLGHTYIPVNKQYAIKAEEQANQMGQMGRSIASATTNWEQGTAAQLEAQKKANLIRNEAQAADLTRMDKLRGMQLESNMATDQYNSKIAAQNAALSAEAHKQIPLINANQILSNQNAFNNLLLATDRNRGVVQYKRSMNEYLQMTQDPQLKAIAKQYQDLASPEGRAKAEAAYKIEKDTASQKGLTNYNKTFEESEAGKAYNKQLKDIMEQYNLLLEPIKQKQAEVQSKQALLYLAKGGKNLTKDERIELENNRYNNVRKLKQFEMIYKAILHNNEMLQKSLIKVFK